MGTKNSTSPKDKWLQEGYRQFADHGPDKLSINQISKEIGASRASFYHHFGDADIFIDQLLGMHWEICKQFDRDAAAHCRELVPDLYYELAKYPVSLRFNLQLFHHRNITGFNYIFSRSFKASAEAFALRLFASHLDLRVGKKELLNLWITLGEAWYSRLDPDDLEPETLIRHADDIMQSFTQFIQSKLYQNLR
jgi:AcrR family transcriptional regulator